MFNIHVTCTSCNYMYQEMYGENIDQILQYLGKAKKGHFLALLLYNKHCVLSPEGVIYLYLQSKVIKRMK